MLSQTHASDETKWTRKPWLFYVIALGLWIACWTAGRYFDRDYGHSLLECFEYALWSATTESAGPLLIVSGMTAAAIDYVLQLGGYIRIDVLIPVCGLAVYIALAAGMSRIGRDWHPLVHLFIALSWLLVGTLFLTMFSGK